MVGAVFFGGGGPLTRVPPPPPAGGLLICLPREQAARFCAELKAPGRGEGHQAWIIGIVEKGPRGARVIDKPRLIEVTPRGAPAPPDSPGTPPGDATPLRPF